MKKKTTLMILAVLCLLVLSACGCKHETWVDADCVTPKTCAECGETEGAPLGHSWAAATCEAAKTCENCGETEGQALGHSWQDATCTAAKRCSGCGLTEGDALGHDWADATTEAPKTCGLCGLTEGERIITDERFRTADCRMLFGKWVAQMPIPMEEMAMEGFEGSLDFLIYLDFSNDGVMSVTMDLADPEGFLKVIGEATREAIYGEFESQGMSREAADKAFQNQYGMSIDEYVTESMKEVDMSSIFSLMNIKMKYYVEDGDLYTGISWDMEMTANYIEVEGDSLIMAGDMETMGAETLNFKRVTE